MRMIKTKVHGFFDYLMGLVLIITPLLLNLASNEAETWVPVTIGAIIILYSLFTNYEWGVARIIPMRTHLLLDLITGILLGTSPWFLGFSKYVWQPHFLLGVIMVCISLTTKPRPPLEFRRHRISNREVINTVIEP